ncbi:MBL fold metallo-hydrolase [Erysipelatoclostridium sp. An15]|uniref:MBL fold metallo-hydrolase n=1 Tax=Erysipelatoclostridium sp. An15 TaxID=1965566 RepID=UPI000B3A5A9C|nr:MBL fold metallo-hydrolase [Erysipelatoclostridium sp. An15]OUQ06820.1 MBL fold metallo-hydrolase [Erysipelatoclostridium sp. An15]
MQITEYFPNFYIIDDGHVREFLIIGSTEALLIDTGFGNTDLKSKIQKITNLPVKVVLSHGDKDHSGGLKQFDECYVHKNDLLLIDGNIKVKEINEGDILEAGEYKFEVIEIPGHSYGSIAFLDRNKKLLLPGDSVQTGPIYMFGQHRNLDLYLQSLEKLLTYQDDITTIIPSHHHYPLTKEYINYCLEDGHLLKEKQIKGIKHQTLPCYEYTGKHVSFYY